MPFGVRFTCIVYIAYMDTVVLIVKKRVIRFAHCIDSKDKLYTFLHVVFTRMVYIPHISKHNQLSSRNGSDNMGLKKKHNILFVSFTLLCHFLK